ncbi:MAG: methionyl-tRNA formyltransferase [bacterium]|nr:methionyl-tRNA formyltransferase [bacterium]
MQTTNNKKTKIAFFGTPEVAVYVLDELEKAGILPDIVITAPDKPKGRKLILTPPPAKVWAVERGIPVEQPRKLSNLTNELKTNNYELFIVAAYGKIIPKEILDIPRYGTLNVHPSLLPRLRGASPIQSAILRENETGVTIMVVDEEMDHGPIVAQRQLEFPISNFKFLNLQEKLARMGGRLLVEVIPQWIAGKIKPKEQEHNKATYCEKITKQDGLITENDSPETIFRKIRAFTPWPGAYFFAGEKRIIVTDAEMKNGALVIKRVKPEGKKEMPLEDFLRGNKEAGNYIKKLTGEDIQKGSQHGAD